MKLGRAYVDAIGESDGNLFVILFGVDIGSGNSGRRRILGYGCSMSEYLQYFNDNIMFKPITIYPVLVNSLRVG